MYWCAHKTATLTSIQDTVTLHLPGSYNLSPGETFLAFFSGKTLDPIQNHITARSKLQSLRSHISRPCCVTLPNISWVGSYSLHTLVPTALDPDEIFSVFFWTRAANLNQELRQSVSTHIFSQSISKNVSPIQSHITARSKLLEVTYLEALLSYVAKISWVEFFSLHPWIRVRHSWSFF